MDNRITVHLVRRVERDVESRFRSTAPRVFRVLPCASARKRKGGEKESFLAVSEKPSVSFRSSIMIRHAVMAHVVSN